MRKNHSHHPSKIKMVLATDTAIDSSAWDERRQRLASHSLLLRHERLSQFPSADQQQLLAEARFLVIDTLRVNQAIINAAPNCAGIIRVGDGYDNIDVVSATEQGIICCNQPGIWSYETAEYAYLLGLMQLRRIPQLITDHLRPPGGMRPFRQVIGDYAPISTARNITVGIVGFGRIGQAVCSLYGQLVQRILISDPHATAASLRRFARRGTSRATLHAAPLQRLLAESDILTLHIPMRPQNRHLLSDTAFAQMKPTAIIVNCARGGLIDSDALYRAVTNNQIASAALDLTDPDPLPADHPLRKSDRIHITPHFAWYSDDAVRRMSQSITDTVIALSQRRIPSCALNATNIARDRMRILHRA